MEKQRLPLLRQRFQYVSFRNNKLESTLWTNPEGMYPLCGLIHEWMYPNGTYPFRTNPVGTNPEGMYPHSGLIHEVDVSQRDLSFQDISTSGCIPTGLIRFAE